MSSTKNVEYTKSQLLAIMTACILNDKITVFVGIGIPMIAAELARRTLAPNMTVIFEGGIIAPELKDGKLPTFNTGDKVRT